MRPTKVWGLHFFNGILLASLKNNILNFFNAILSSIPSSFNHKKIIDYDKSMPEEGDKKSNPDFDKISDLGIFEIKPFKLN